MAWLKDKQYVSSAVSEEDHVRNTVKTRRRRRGGRRRRKEPVEGMDSPRQSSAEDHHGHHRKHSRYSRHWRRSHGNNRDATDNDPVYDVPRESRRRRSHCRTNQVIASDSSDEVLIRDRDSRRFRRETSKHSSASRQPKSSEKAQQREQARRPSSSSSREIHIHYIPIVTTSATPPAMSSRRHSRSGDHAVPDADIPAIRVSKSVGVCASELTEQLKGLTMSWISKHTSSGQSARRNKHERRDKHGKKREVSKSLAPLAERWICYRCGKLRSDSFHSRHPLKEGLKMQPNWCGRCRVYSELKGKTLSWSGQRHFCWGCGIIRSKSYHRSNRIAEGEAPAPNYCRACREGSPNFEYNLREASEVGSEMTIRDQAFQRQMHDAELSDIEEDDDNDDDTTRAQVAPGKENEDPIKSNKIKRSDSFIRRHCCMSNKTKSSEGSNEGGVPISKLKAMHLEAERARNSVDGEGRAMSSAYNPPHVQSVLDEGLDAGMPISSEAQPTSDKEGGGCTVKAADPVADEQLSRENSRGSRAEDCPTELASGQKAADASSTKKKVHWGKEGNQPMTATAAASASESTLPHVADSGCSSSYRSSLSSKKSTGLRGPPRRHPAEESTGSPLEREGAVSSEDLGDSSRKAWAQKASLARQFSHGGYNFRQGSSAQQASSEAAYILSAEMPPASRGQAPSGFSYQTASSASSATCAPPVDMGTTPFYSNNLEGQQSGRGYWGSQHPQPSSQHTFASYNLSGDPVSYQGYDAYSAFTNQQPYPGFDSAAYFSDSTTRRDFSGYAAPAEAGFDRYGFSRNCNDGFFASAGDGCAFPPPPGYPEFDFANMGETNEFKAAKDEFYTHVPMGVDQTFTRDKKFTRNNNNNNNRSRTPRSEASWRLYDDGDMDEKKKASTYEWYDGQTTVHHEQESYLTNSGNRVTILSIRELKSDEELSEGENGGDADGSNDSDLDTVIHKSTTKSLCSA